MKRPNPSFLSALAAAVLVTGCAGDKDRYPSLAIRDVERTAGQFTPTEPEELTPIRPVASAGDIAALLARAEQSHGRFVQTRPGVADLVRMARGRGIESNVRQRALVAFADLTTLRSDTAIAMGNLDLLKAEAATTFAPTEDIELAQAEVATLLAEQDEALDALWEQLAQ